MLLRFLRHRRRWPKLISSSAAATAAVGATSVVAAAGAGSGSSTAARTKAVEDVRRRLSGVQGRGLLGTLWDEAVRAVRDTVAMGGRGLV